MRVRAIRIGYYDHKRRYPADHAKGKDGKDVFILVAMKIKKDGKDVVITPEDQFSYNWMEKVEGGKGRAKAEAKAPDNENEEEVI